MFVHLFLCSKDLHKPIKRLGVFFLERVYKGIIRKGIYRIPMSTGVLSTAGRGLGKSQLEKRAQGPCTKSHPSGFLHPETRVAGLTT